MLHHAIHRIFHTSTNTYPKCNLKRAEILLRRGGFLIPKESQLKEEERKRRKKEEEEERRNIYHSSL
jgi:hypothetical protein